MEVVSTKPVGLATVKKIFEERAEAEEELGYEQQQTLDYVRLLAVLDEKAAVKLVAELQKNDKINEETALKIADVLPKHTETLDAILLKDKLELSEEERKQILELVEKASS